MRLKVHCYSCGKKQKISSISGAKIKLMRIASNQLVNWTDLPAQLP
jgi:hypothetical protein